MGWIVVIIVAVLIVLGGVWAYRQEVDHRRRTGRTRPERHDPGEKYVPPPPPAG